MTDPIPPARLRKPSLSLREWFRFTDREHFHPAAGATITTRRFTHVDVSDQKHVDWEKEEWGIRKTLSRAQMTVTVLEKRRR